MARPDIRCIRVTFMSGELAWGPESIPSCMQVLQLKEMIRLSAAIPAKSAISLLCGTRELADGESLGEAGASAETFMLVVREMAWPASSACLRSAFADKLEHFLERPPQWQRLASKPQTVPGFAKGLLKRLPDNDFVCALLQQLGLDETYVLPLELQDKARGISAESPVDVVADVVRSAVRHAEKNSVKKARRFQSWPAKKEPQEMMGLVLAARIHEHGLHGFGNAEVDGLAAELFVGRPDFPLLRREMLGMGYFQQLPREGFQIGGYVLHEEQLSSVLSRLLAN